MKPVEEQTLPERLRVRACIRRQIRAKGDRIARDLDEAADRIEELERALAQRQARDG